MRLIALALTLLALPACIGPAAELTANGVVISAGGRTIAGMTAAVEAGAVLALPENLSDLRANVVDDADSVWIEADSATRAIELLEAGDGVYQKSTAQDPALVYTAGATYSLHASWQGDRYSISMEAPPPADLSDLPQTHPTGAALDVDLSGQGFDHAVVVVTDGAGNVTWDNRPGGVEDLIFALLEPGSESNVEIPGTAFPNHDSYYGIAVLGLDEAGLSGLDGFGPVLTNFAMGEFAFAAITTR